jgi:hypothetical protein
MKILNDDSALKIIGSLNIFIYFSFNLSYLLKVLLWKLDRNLLLPSTISHLLKFNVSDASSSVRNSNLNPLGW